MNDLPRHIPSHSAPGHAPGVHASSSVRRLLLLGCAAAAVAAAALVALGIDCVIYLAFTGEPPSLTALVHQVPQWICGVLRACSA